MISIAQAAASAASPPVGATAAAITPDVLRLPSQQVTFWHQ